MSKSKPEFKVSIINQPKTALIIKAESAKEAAQNYINTLIKLRFDLTNSHDTIPLVITEISESNTNLKNCLVVLSHYNHQTYEYIIDRVAYFVSLDKLSDAIEEEIKHNPFITKG